MLCSFDVLESGSAAALTVSCLLPLDTKYLRSRRATCMHGISNDICVRDSAHAWEGCRGTGCRHEHTFRNAVLRWTSLACCAISFRRRHLSHFNSSTCDGLRSPTPSTHPSCSLSVEQLVSAVAVRSSGAGSSVVTLLVTACTACRMLGLQSCIGSARRPSAESNAGDASDPPQSSAMPRALLKEVDAVLRGASAGTLRLPVLTVGYMFCSMSEPVRINMSVLKRTSLDRHQRNIANAPVL